MFVTGLLLRAIFASMSVLKEAGMHLFRFMATFPRLKLCQIQILELLYFLVVVYLNAAVPSVPALHLTESMATISPRDKKRGSGYEHCKGCSVSGTFPDSTLANADRPTVFLKQ